LNDLRKSFIQFSVKEGPDSYDSQTEHFQKLSRGYDLTAMKFDSLIFDLDGTLWDTCHACAIAWNNVLKTEGINYRTISSEDVRTVTGRPHEECIRLTFKDLSESQILRISESTAAEDNRVIDEVGGVLYEGVIDGLERLKGNYSLFIVSNCQSGYIETFLHKSQLTNMFEDFECWGNTGMPKGKNLQSVIVRNGLKSPLMIGDADGDETAARECGIPFAYVTYGFGMSVAPDFQFESFPELEKCLTDLNEEHRTFTVGGC
jgi:phosphoglycolate phosphatase